MERLISALWRLTCHVAFWSGAGPLVAWLARRLRPMSWTIVTYHRIGSEKRSDGPEVVSPARFRRHLRYLRKRYEVLPVGEALNRTLSGEPSSRPLASITFDDGYRDNVSSALPILIEEHCRATLYATIEAVQGGLPPWPHALANDLMALACNARAWADLPLDGLHHVLQRFLNECRRREQSRWKHVQRLVEQIKALPNAERQRVCAETSRLAGERSRAAAEMMHKEDLLQWQKAGMEIGSHTCEHAILSRQPADERRRDLEESKQWLEGVLQSPILHLAYPNGRAADFDDAVIEDVKLAGYRSAATTLEGKNYPEADPFRLKRFSVGDDPLPVFAMRVSGLFSCVRAWLRDRSAGWVSVSVDGSAACSRPLRIAFIGGRGVGGAYSGIERYYEELGSRLAAQGHRVLVYCRSYFTPGIRTYRGMEVRRVPTLRSKHLETFIHTLLATLDVCFRRVDIVQYHALGSSPFAWIPRLAGKRSVVSVRGLDWQRAKWGAIARSYLRLCEATSLYCPNATVVVSRTMQEHFEAHFGRRVCYIPNGVSAVEPIPPAKVNRWGLKPRTYFLYAGRLSPEKLLESLIHAHQMVDGDCPLVIAGGSSYSEGYIRRLRELAGPGVIFTGLLKGHDLQELYAHALAFILPSQMEGFSVALIEAMAHGLPVIASDIPENREIVEACGGYLFTVGDPVTLAAALEKVLRDREGARRVGEVARDRVLARFSWDRITQETETLYRRLMSRSRPGGARVMAELSKA